MKKSRGFTLIELLIVTVVIVTLMAIVFRLAGTGGESTARAKTPCAVHSRRGTRQRYTEPTVRSP